MNIPQTSYSQYFAVAILGMQAIAGELARKISRVGKGIIYYGRAVVQSRLNDAVCRMPRSNKIVITDNAGTWTAGDLVTTIVLGFLKNGEVDASSLSPIVVTTPFGTSKDASMAAHAAAIKGAIADCFSCVYNSGDHTITYIGDCFDVISCVTSISGITGTMTISSEAISTADTAADILGYSYLTHDRQQQISGISYYMETEPVNIMQGGTIWVHAEEAVTPADAPYARLITNSTKYAGYVGKSADSSKCVAQTGSKFTLSISAAGLVPFTVNLPQ